jgi:putative RecB family exonuclease
MSYKREPITDAERLKTIRLSPSSINTFGKCPRRWYYEYIEAKQTGPSIHFQRGTAVHSVLEHVFTIRSFPSGEKFREVMMDKAHSLFEDAWKDNVIDVLELDDKTNQKYYNESKFMVERFINKFCDNIQAGIMSGEFSSERQGFYFLRPMFKEFWVDDEYEMTPDGKYRKDDDGNKIPKPDTLHVGGFVDSINKTFDKSVILVDYKTSKKYKNALSDEYVLQLAIYAYLWQKQYGILPEYVSINYLKYDESFFIQVTPSLIQHAIRKIKDMRNAIVENQLDIKNYNANFTRLCDWCPFQKECAETEEKLKEEQKE